MTSLTELGVAAIRDGVRAGEFSAREVAQALVAAVEQGRGLNAARRSGYAIALPLPMKGNLPTLTVLPAALAAASVRPTEATCGRE